MNRISLERTAAMAAFVLSICWPASAVAAVPGEVQNLEVSGASLSWDPAQGALYYSVYRAPVAGLPGPADCVAGALSDLIWNDASGVAVGDAVFYLVAGLNADGLGSLGAPGAPNRQPGTPCDSDGDGLDDVLEVTSGLDPAARDSDGDDLSDPVEIARGTDPLLADTDGDGVLDAFDPHPSDAAAQTDPYAIYLKSGAFVPPPGKDPALNGLGDPESLVFVQLAQPPGPQTLLDLGNQFGAVFVDYLPELTWYAGVPTAQLDALAADPRVRWVGAIQPLHRLDPQLSNEGPTAEAYNPDGTVTLITSARTDVPPSQLEPDVYLLGATRIDSTYAGQGIYEIDLPEASIPALAQLNSVIFIEQGRWEAIDSGAMERIVTNVDQGPGSPAGTPRFAQAGAGITLMQQEGNLFSGGLADETHPELSGRVTHNPSTINRSEHATHVAGIMLADGGFDGSCTACQPQARGMAPAADLVSYYSPWTAGDARHDLEDAVTTYGARATNDSWGYKLVKAGRYGNVPQAYDEMIQGDATGTRIIAVASAGNGRAGGPNVPHCDRTDAGDLFDCIGSPATAKNVITVGSVHGGVLSTSSFSAFGPTDDGRLKPEVMAPGEFVFSPIQIGSTCAVPGGCGGNCIDTVASTGSATCTCGVTTTNCSTQVIADYGSYIGTSMAAPVVTGGVALLLQTWSDLGLTGLLGDPLPSTIKAVLIHTATDLANAGTTGPASPRDGPSFRNGFGLIDMNGAHRLLERDAVEPLIFELDGITSTGMTAEVEFTVQPTDLGSSFHVTLAWDDFAAATSTAKTLVNDFDLEVVAPDGTTIYHPWILDPAHPASSPNCFVTDLNSTVDSYTPCTDSDAGGATLTDRANNVEMVEIRNPTQAGIWKARVIGRSILKRAGFTPRFSLIIPFDHDVECGDVLSKDAVLFEDLPACTDLTAVTLGNDGVDFDCSGHSLTGNGYNTGVQVDGRLQVSVRNCLIQRFNSGIRGADVVEGQFLDNTFIDNNVHIYLDDASLNQVRRNHMRGGSGDGVWIGGPDNVVEGNQMEDVGQDSVFVAYQSTAAPATLSSGNMVQGNRSWWGGTGADLRGETTTLLSNQFCFNGVDALDLHGSATDTQVVGNLLCQAGATDLELTTVGSISSVQDPASDDNVCTTYGTDSSGMPWADAGEVAGCTASCAPGACMAESVPSIIDDDWDFVDPNDMVFLGASVDPEGQVNLLGGWSSLGPGVIVNTQPPGGTILARRHFMDSQLGNRRRVGTRLYRKAPGSNTWVPQAFGGVAGLRGSMSDLLIGDGSTYRAFSPVCDHVVTQLDAPQTSPVIGNLAAGQTLCMVQGAAYTNVALDLDVPGITLDCRGATLTGPGTCVDVHDVGGVKVVDCVLQGCGTSLSFTNAPDAGARLNRVDGGMVGIRVMGSPGAAVAGNVVCGPVQTPLDLDSTASADLNTCDSGCGIRCDTPPQQ